jgi:DNA-binding NtrC family response regulator
LLVVMALALPRRTAAAGSGHVRTDGLLRWLGLCSAVALLRLFSASLQRFSVELAETAALAALGAIALEFALTLPDAIGPVRYRTGCLVANYAIAALSAFLACLALSPEVHVFGGLWLLPAFYGHAAAVYASCAVLLACGLRVVRQRSSRTREVATANAFGLAGLLPAVLFGSVLWFGAAYVAPWFVRVLAAVAATALSVSHARLLSTRPGPAFSNRVRDALAAGASVVLVTVVVAAYPGAFPRMPLARAAWLLGTFLLVVGLYAVLSRAFRTWLAPDGGRLLSALDQTRAALARAQTLDAMIAATLTGLRTQAGAAPQAQLQPAAQSGPSQEDVQRSAPQADLLRGVTKPLLYGFDPPFEGYCDAAGAPHVQSRAPHPLLAARLSEHSTELLMRAELELQVLRQPAVRPLLEVLIEQDVLCVVPLCMYGELEGALLLPRGERTTALSHEEQTALWEFARQAAGLLAVFAAEARAERRAGEATLEAQRVHSEIGRLNGVVEHLAVERALLHDGRPAKAETPPVVGYSDASRALRERVCKWVDQPVPVLFVIESGLAIAPLARLLHTQGPFIELDCGSVRADLADAALFGGDAGHGPEVGALRIADHGCLLLHDLPALPLAVQEKLAWALSSGRAVAVGATESYALGARLIVSARGSVEELAAMGRFSRELAHQLAPVTCRVPPLRECREDIVSLVLLALDRGGRRHGRGPIGIEPDALSALRAYDFPGNHVELDQMVERAARHARGVRLSLADFVAARALPGDTTVDIWDAPLADIERKAIARALARSGGDKGEAARLLGLRRGTLQDKLRRLALDEPKTQPTRAN